MPFFRTTYIKSGTSTLAILLALTSCLTHAASASAANAPPAAKVKASSPLAIHDKWAVLVGVGHYQDNSIGPIKYASRNVLSLTQSLCDTEVGHFLPDHVMVATEDKVTRESLADSTWQNWLSKRALPTDLIILYICTRYATTDDASDILLLTSESKVSAKETSGTSLSSILGELHRRTQCKNIVAMLDITPTDAVAKRYPYGLGQLMQSIAQKTGCSIFCADDKMLGSLDDAQNRQSFFVEYIGEGLKAGAGTLPIEAIASYVSQTLSSQPTAPAGNYNSHPLLFPSLENPELTKVALGLKIHKTNDVSEYKIGKLLSKVALTNPALAAHLAELDASTSGNNAAKNLLKQQDMQEEDEAAERKAAEKEKEEEDEAADGDSNVDFAPYMAAMKKAIQAKWVTPKGLEQKTIVAVFNILRDGKIDAPEIVEGSGSAAIDQSALKALADASPLAPLPKGAPKKVQIRYKFDWKVTH